MNKVYIYESDDGFDLYLSDRELSDEERYCPQCDEYSLLKGVTSDIEDMKAMFNDYGYTPDCDKYHELIEQFNTIIGG